MTRDALTLSHGRYRRDWVEHRLFRGGIDTHLLSQTSYASAPRHRPSKLLAFAGLPVFHENVLIRLNWSKSRGRLSRNKK